MIEHDSIGLLLGRFGLSGMQSQLEEIEAAAQNGSWTYRQFLRELFEREEAMRSGRRLKRLLKESQRMSRCWNLLNALPKGAGAPANVENLCLVKRNFDCTRPDKICCRMNVCKGCVHHFSPPLHGAVV